jgi:hypothetical protein
LGRGFAQFELCADLLNLRRLLLHPCRESRYFGF